MEFSLQIFVNDVCKSVIRIPVGDEIGLKLVAKEDTPPPVDFDVYRKCREVAAYMLFVKDIQNKYNLQLDVTKKKVADILWPSSPQKPQYHSIAYAMKSEIRRKGWLLKEPVNALSLETCEAVEEILRNL